jgi:hypothetical protein
MGFSRKVSLGIILSFFVVIIGSQSAFADRVSNIGPTPDASSGGTAYYAVGTGSFDGRDSWVKIYVPNGQSTDVTVSQACNLDVGDPDVNYRLFRLNQQETFTTLIQSRDGENTDGSCRSSVTFSINNTTGIASTRTGHENWRAFFLRASINNSIGDNERSFRIISSNPNSYVSSAKGIGADVANKPFNIYHRDLGRGQWDYSIPFASVCRNNLPANERLWRIYDADQGIYQNNLNASLVRSSNRSGNYDVTQDSWGPSNFGGNGAVNNFSISVDDDFIYKLNINNIDWRNTLQIYLPYDQIDALPTTAPGSTTCEPVKQWEIDSRSALEQGISGTNFNTARFNHVVRNLPSSKSAAESGQHYSHVQYIVKRGNSSVWRDSSGNATDFFGNWPTKSNNYNATSTLNPNQSFRVKDGVSNSNGSSTSIPRSADLRWLLQNNGNPRNPVAGDTYCERIVSYDHVKQNINGSVDNGPVYSNAVCVTIGTQTCAALDWQVQHSEYTSGPHALNDAWVGDSYTFYHNFWHTGHASQTPDIGFTRYRENSQSDGLGLHSLGFYNPSFSVGPFGPQDAGKIFESNVGFGPMASLAPDHCNSGGTDYSTAESVTIPYFYHLYPKLTVSAANIQQSESIRVTTTMTQPNENNEPNTNDIGRPHTYTDPLNYRTVECTLPSGTQPWATDSSANTYNWTDSVLGPTMFGASKGGQSCQEITALSGNDRVWRNNISNESINSNHQTRNGSDTVLPVGTKVCYFLSVSNGAYEGLSGPKNQWRHSVPSCTAITKSPKVRFENSDVLTGRQIPKSADDSDCDPLNNNAEIIATGTTKYIVDNPSLVGGSSFVNQTGSWGEYGVFATGQIKGLGSAAFAYGQDSNSVRKLHFGNQSPSGNFRSYGSACTFNWFEKLTKNAENVDDENVTIESLAGKVSQRSKNNRWKVSASSLLEDTTTPTILYAKKTGSNCNGSEGVIEITSDITYKASYPSIKDIPRVILMADCGIIINQNVRNLDVGLVTRGTINTCDVKVSNGAPIGLDTNKNYGLTKADCDKDLKITGPVVTKKINLLRTAYSDMSSALLTINPAEYFAQNPSYLISTYEQARQKINLTVEYQDELPPRY